MSESRVPVVNNVCGHMGGVAFESDSSDESSQGTVELDFEEPGTASLLSIIEGASFSERVTAPCEVGGVMVSSLESPPPASSEGKSILCETRAKAAGIVERTRLGHQCVDNTFGIAYKPCEGSSQEYNLPSGPAFVDEVEFEREMSAEFRVVAGASDGDGQTPTSCNFALARNTKTAIDTDDFFYGDLTAVDVKMAQDVSRRG